MGQFGQQNVQGGLMNSFNQHAGNVCNQHLSNSGLPQALQDVGRENIQKALQSLHNNVPSDCQQGCSDAYKMMQDAPSNSCNDVMNQYLQNLVNQMIEDAGEACKSQETKEKTGLIRSGGGAGGGEGTSAAASEGGTAGASASGCSEEGSGASSAPEESTGEGEGCVCSGNWLV